MQRSDVIREISRQDGLVVCNLGMPCRELFAAGDRPDFFYMLGSMGLASSVGLGLALAQPGQVYVIDGDGSIMMNLGSLITIAHNAPRNFCLVIVDNGAYGSTGNQPTYTARKADLAAIATASGNANVARSATLADLRLALNRCGDESLIVIAATTCEAGPAPVIPYGPVAIRQRFMEQARKKK